MSIDMTIRVFIFRLLIWWIMLIDFEHWTSFAFLRQSWLGHGVLFFSYFARFNLLIFLRICLWVILVCGRRQWHSTPVLLPRKSHGWRSLVGRSPWGHWGSDTTEGLHFHFSLSCVGEGNGNPLQCSCLENPRDWGAWWAAVYGVAQSPTQLKWPSSSKSNLIWNDLNPWQIHVDV